MCVCVECLIGKQKKPILFKVTEPSSVPYSLRAPSACAKRAAYPDPRLCLSRCCIPAKILVLFFFKNIFVSYKDGCHKQPADY